MRLLKRRHYTLVICYLAAFATTILVLCIATLTVIKSSSGQKSGSFELEVEENDVALADTIQGSLTSSTPIIVQDLSEIESKETIFEYSVALDEILVHASEQELISLLEKSSEISRNYRRELVRHAIIQRLAAINPLSAIDQLKNFSSHHADQLVMSILREWSMADLESALQYAESIVDMEHRQNAIATVMKSRGELSRSALFSLATNLDIRPNTLSRLYDIGVTIS